MFYHPYFFNPYIFPDMEIVPKLGIFNPALAERTIDGREIMDVEYEEITSESTESHELLRPSSCADNQRDCL